MGMSFPVLQYTAVPQCSGSPEKSFLRGESSAAAGGSTGGAVIRGCDDAASFYDGKEDGRGWMENLLAAVRDQIPALREEARQKIRCLPGQKQRKRIRRSRIRIRDREQKEGRQNRRSRELRKIKRMELKR